jgi:hypothetical protein
LRPLDQNGGLPNGFQSINSIVQWLRVLTTKDKVHLSGHEKNPAPVSLLSGSAGILQVKNLDLFINFF